MSTNQAAGLSEKFSGELMTPVTERGDHARQRTPMESSSSSSEENQLQPHLKQLKLDHTPNQSANIMLQGPHAASETGLTFPSPMNAPQYSQARKSLPMRPPTGNASVWSLPHEVDNNLNSQNQLNVPPQTAFRAEYPSQNQFNVPPQTAFRAEYSSQTNFGVPNQGSAQMQIDQSVRSARNNNYGAVNNYHLPLSNLPTEFRLDQMARPPPPNFSAPFVIGTGGSPLPNTHWPNWAPQSQITMHEPSSSQLGPQQMQLQGFMNKARGPSNFYPTNVTSSHNQFPNMPIQQRKMFSMDVTAPMPNQVNWSTQGQGNQGQASNPRFPGNSLYDPIYESMGLPIDPHLRLFIATRDKW